MFENQPKGLWALALANTGERFGYYTMLAVFLLYLQANFGFETGLASTIYSTFLMMVYFLPIIGGIAADKFGFGRMVTTGIFIMFIGYLVLSLPLGKDTVAIAAMGISLILIALGTGLFKGNLQVMVGRLYDEPQYASNRDSGFSLFYMAINIGAMFAPTAAIKIMKWAQESLSVSVEDSYHLHSLWHVLRLSLVSPSTMPSALHTSTCLLLRPRVRTTRLRLRRLMSFPRLRPRSASSASVSYLLWLSSSGWLSTRMVIP